MSEQCKWLHEQLQRLPLVRHPFDLDRLPENGIYFFYETGESWGHGGDKPRVVRVGTHRDGNFRSRIAEHYLFNNSKMNFNKDNPKPSDRSIFRKNIGRALLNRNKDAYLEIWEIDFMISKNKMRFAEKRDIDKERELETEITRLLRSNFSFRFIELTGQTRRMGPTGLESSLIGTLALCSLCKPSNNWLGKHSPKDQIRNGKLWLVQHLRANPINEEDRRALLESRETTNCFTQF
jgi:hypothetical protein